MARYGFASRLVTFFRDYLAGRRSCFRWGNAVSPWFDLPAVGAGQGSALSPVLTNIYISPALHVLSPPRATQSSSAIQFYVDDGLWIVTTPSIAENCRILQEKHRDTSTVLARLGLVTEDDKSELMHFACTCLARSQDMRLPLVLSPTLSIEPSDVWRYLGFRLDSKLTFRAHVAHFAERATTTISAMLMLGNSVRGLSAMQRRTLYISCVLPLLTYGVQAWYRPKGVKTLIKPLEVAQHRALRWITGAFRTTPVGALHSVAGIMPIGLQCQKLQERYFLRLHTLPDSHPLRAHFPNILGHAEHAPHVRFPAESIKPTPTIPLTTVFPRKRPLITEVFDPLDDECQPGTRVRDLFEDRISTHFTHPKKRDEDAMAKWIAEELRPRIDDAHANTNALVIFTDGSAYLEPDPRTLRTGSAAGYRAYHKGRLIHSRAIFTGHAHSYDRESVALSMAVAFAYQKGRYTQVHIFSDSESALTSILNTTGGRMAAVNTCRILRDWFERSPDNHLHLHYCPGHSGIAENEAVDADVKLMALEPGNVRFYGRFPTFHSYIKSSITEDAVYEWREQALKDSRKYWGRHFLINHPSVRTFKHTGNFPLKRLDGGPVITARLVRCLTGHAPTGSYRLRFRTRLDEPTFCSLHDGAPTMHSREHILFRCNYYTGRSDTH